MRRCSRFSEHKGLKLDLGKFEFSIIPESGLIKAFLYSNPNYSFILDYNLTIAGHGMIDSIEEIVDSIKKIRRKNLISEINKDYTFEKKEDFLVRIPKDLSFRQNFVKKNKDLTDGAIYFFDFLKMRLVKDLIPCIFNKYYDSLRLDVSTYDNVCKIR